jgi:hypothetical protein
MFTSKLTLLVKKKTSTTIRKQKGSKINAKLSCVDGFNLIVHIRTVFTLLRHKQKHSASSVSVCCY